MKQYAKGLVEVSLDGNLDFWRGKGFTRQFPRRLAELKRDKLLLEQTLTLDQLFDTLKRVSENWTWVGENCPDRRKGEAILAAVTEWEQRVLSGLERRGIIEREEQTYAESY
jgi:hypothetical protein